MRKHVANWLHARTGLADLVRGGFDRPIPGGARWRYVFGSALATLFLVEVATGTLLMTAYSPSATTAWGSVYYLQHGMSYGWFVRGMHRFATTAMVALVVLHLLQSAISGAFRAPREILWWLVVALVPLTLAMGLTGNILPWDQRGYWAATVETTIAGGTPVIGPTIQRLIVGGPQLGNLTLSRIYVLHVLILPLVFFLLLRLQAAQVRKHGPAIPERSAGRSEPYWPRQAFFNGLAGLVAVAILAFLVHRSGGADLDAPADPQATDYPARPEWYVLWLNRLLSLLPGEYEVVATVLVPGALAAALLSLPLLDRILPRGRTHFLACGIVFGMVGGAGFLIYDALKADRQNTRFAEARREADRMASRAIDLAGHPDRAGIPPSGAADLLRTDPLTRGMAIFEQKCASCHAYGDKSPPAGAPMQGWNLKGYASKGWIRDLLADPGAPAFRGHVRKAPGSDAVTEAPLDGMKQWKASYAIEPEEIEPIAEFLATFAATPADATFEEWSADPALKRHPAYEVFVENCCQCHAVGDWGEKAKVKKAPALFAYGSRRWVSDMIKRPGARGFYGYLKPHEQMPEFRDQLSPADLEMVVRLLAGDYLEPSIPGK